MTTSDVRTTDVDTCIRPALTGDLPLIFDSWLKDSWASLGEPPWPKNFRSETMALTPRTVWDRGQRQMIARALAICPARVLCDVTDPDMIYGWICAGTDPAPVLHYVWVRGSMRGFGFARKLLTDAGVDKGALTVTHVARLTMREAEYRPVVYDPFFLAQR